MKGLKGLGVEEKLLELIKIPSTTPPGDVSGVVKLLGEFGKETGAAVTLQEVEPGKCNCILTYTFGPGPTLLFNTHMDVNNPQGQQWSFDPFEPFVKGDRICGLGACDAKGSLAAMLAALEVLAADPRELQGTLLLTAVMGEEAGGLGSLHLVEQGVKAHGAVVGEPTGLQVCTAHKGTYMRRLTFRGRAAHSASSHLGINAIHHCAAFCVEYAALQETLDLYPHPVLGPANANVTVIRGGTRQNTIPQDCEVIIDRRLLPGEDRAKADWELAKILARLKSRIPELDCQAEVIVSTIPSQTEVGERIVATTLDCAARTVGEERKPQGFNAGCDMSKLVTVAGIPTVILGPGSLKQAHAPDEFVQRAQLLQAAKIYEEIARRFLAEGHYA